MGQREAFWGQADTFVRVGGQQKADDTYSWVSSKSLLTGLPFSCFGLIDNRRSDGLS